VTAMATKEKFITNLHREESAFYICRNVCSKTFLSSSVLIFQARFGHAIISRNRIYCN